MPKRMLIDALHPEEMRVVIAENQTIHEFDFASATKKQVKGNVYLAKITRVEPSLQAAFVEYGGGKQGFLPFSEIHPDYYQIPVSDRKRLMEEVERELEQEIAEEEALLNAADNAADAEQVSEGVKPEGFENISETAEPYEQVSVAQATPFEVNDFTASEPDIEVVREQSVPETSDSVISVSEPIGQDVENQQEQQDNQEQQEVQPAASNENGESVETIMSEEDEASTKRKKRVPFFKRYRIQEVIKRGQVVLVQVIKEERGNKGVSLTTYLSLAGRYSVLMPNSPRDGGVSRKISDINTRKRLKELMSELQLAKGMSVIIRTAGVDRTRAEIRRDFDYLVKLWNQIREDTLSSSAPALIYEESNLIKRSIRDQYTSDIDELVVAGEQGFKEAKEFMELLLPSHTPKVRLYTENMPLFYAYGIEEQLISMYDPVVKLKSGGYIVINPTEALISIDVNSGRSTSERNIEETATKTNIEAAYEIARQLRLRDLAGLIVVDFIDMLESRNRRTIERAIKESLRSDRAKIQLGRISPFGLLEMSRQRMRPSISEASTVPCSHCSGRGIIRSNESLALHVLRTLEKDAANGSWGELRLTVPQSLAIYILNNKRSMLSEIETRYAVTITIIVNLSLAGFEFTVEKLKRDRARSERNEVPMREPRERSPRRGRYERSDYANDADEKTTEAVGDSSAEEEKPSDSKRDDNRRGPRRRGGRNRDNAPREQFNNNGYENAVESSSQDNYSTDVAVVAEESANSEKRPSRNRQNRPPRGGRRRWRDDANTETQAEKPIAPQAAQTAVLADSPTQQPADVYNLPSFTRQSVFEPKIEKVEAVKPVVVESKVRAEGEPPRKGWWQKIIELE